MARKGMRRAVYWVAGMVLAGGSFAATGLADTVHAAFQSVTPAREFSFTLNGGAAETTQAGVFNWSTLPGGTLDLGDFSAFCIELREGVDDEALFDVYDLQLGPQPGQGTGGPGIDGPMGAQKADYLRELWGRHHDEILTGTTGERRDKAAAFQIGIWEIVFDSGLALSAGDFQATEPAANSVVIAQNWLNSITGDRTMFAPGLMALVSPDPDAEGPLHGIQDQVVQVPEPATVGLLLLGVLLRRHAR